MWLQKLFHRRNGIFFSTLNYLLISSRSQGEVAERREERRRTLSASTELNVWDAWEMKQHLSPSFVFHFLICTKLEWKVCFEDLNWCAYQCLCLDDCNLQWISSAANFSFCLKKFRKKFGACGCENSSCFPRCHERFTLQPRQRLPLMEKPHQSFPTTTTQYNDIRSRLTIQTLSFGDFVKIQLCGGTEKFLSQRNLFYW